MSCFMSVLLDGLSSVSYVFRSCRCVSCIVVFQMSCNFMHVVI